MKKLEKLAEEYLGFSICEFCGFGKGRFFEKSLASAKEKLQWIKKREESTNCERLEDFYLAQLIAEDFCLAQIIAEDVRSRLLTFKWLMDLEGKKKKHSASQQMCQIK